MELQLILDSLDSLPKEFHSLYTERDGKFHFTAIKGLKTQEDISRLQTSLEKERNEHKATKEKLSAFSGLNMTVEELHEKLDRIPELEKHQGDRPLVEAEKY